MEHVIGITDIRRQGLQDDSQQTIQQQQDRHTWDSEGGGDGETKHDGHHGGG